MLPTDPLKIRLARQPATVGRNVVQMEQVGMSGLPRRTNLHGPSLYQQIQDQSSDEY
jgi:hypothetical protein